MTTVTLTLELPEQFAKVLASKHPQGLEAAAAVALKGYVTGGRPVKNTDRDAAIVRLILDGKRRADIAREYSLSIVRVNQIAAEHNVVKPRNTAPKLNAEREAAKQKLLRDWADA
jgi:DNA-binding NarL/FixJ family response regulator